MDEQQFADQRLGKPCLIKTQHSPPKPRHVMTLRSRMRWPGRAHASLGAAWVSAVARIGQIRSGRWKEAEPVTWARAAPPNSQQWRAIVGLLKGSFLLKHHLCKGLWAASCQAGSFTFSQMVPTWTQALKKKELQPGSLKPGSLAFARMLPLLCYHMRCLMLSKAFNISGPQSSTRSTRSYQEFPPAWLTETMIFDTVCQQPYCLWSKVTFLFA